MPQKPTYAELEQRVRQLSKMISNRQNADDGPLQSVLRSSTDAMGIVYEGRYEIVNSAFLEMFGYAHESELIGRPVLAQIAPVERERIGGYMRARDMGLPVRKRYRTRGMKKDGSVFDIEVNVARFGDAGKGQKSLTILRDLSDQARTEVALSQQRHFLQKAQEIGKIGTWVLDLPDNTLFWTDETYRIFGIPPGTVLTYEHFMDRVHPEDRAYVDRSWHAALSGAPYDIEHRVLVNGIVKWVREKATLAFDDRGRCLRGTGVTQDITERKVKEKIQSAKLRLIEYSGHHANDVLLQKVLDEVESLTGSQISFFHLVSPDQRSLSIQVWSANTREVCSTAKTVFHSPLDRAGRWAACFRKQMPVVCDECFSMAQGLPEGHVKVVRMMSVPVIRGGAVVAILGAGNKPAPYTDQDVEAAQVLADLSFETVVYKQAEEALKHSEKRFRTLFEQAPIGIALVQPDGRFIHVNRTFQEMLGVTEAEMVDQSFAAWTHPDDVEESRALIRRLRQKETDHLSMEKRYVHRNGSAVWARTAVSAVRNAEGQPDYFIVMVEDITEQRKSREELAASERRYRALFDGASEGILVADVEGKRLQYANPAICRILGYSARELCGMTIEDLIPEDEAEKMLDEFEAHAREEVSMAQGLPFLTRRGTVSLLDVHSAPMDLDGRPCLVGFFTDVTDRTRLEKEKRQLENQLYQAQKIESVGRLAGGVAHDFNNMLSVISGYAEILMEEIPGDKEDNLEAVREILNAAKRSQAITRQLLAFARQQPARPVLIDLNATVESMLKMLRRLIGEDIDLAWQPKTNVWPVKIDPSQIDQVLANLCVNARDAIADVGKIVIETDHRTFDAAYCETHSGFFPGEFVMLAVSDNGRGMSREILDKIFEPFFTTKKVGQGTGLGMSTVYGIIKQNQGFINIYSEPGEGTTVRIYLKRYPGDAPGTLAVPADEIAMGGGQTLLVVEDEPAALKMMTQMLTDLNYQVLAAQTPGQALESAGSCPDDIRLLLTDVIMPEMNGQALSEKIRAMYPEVRCLFMSGYTADIISHHGVLEKDVNFIQKPFSKSELAAKVDALLRRGADV